MYTLSIWAGNKYTNVVTRLSPLFIKTVDLA